MLTIKDNSIANFPVNKALMIIMASSVSRNDGNGEGKGFQC